MTLKTLIFSAMTSAVMFTSCSSFNPANTAKEWEVVKIGTEQVEPGPAAPFIGFDKERIYGYTGCNRINGGIEINGKSVKAKQVATTMKFCPNAKYEQPFLQALNEAENIKETAEGFELTNAKGESVLTFAPKTLDLQTLEGQWNLINMNGEDVQSNEETPFVMFDIKQNLFSGFTGCNRLNTQLDLEALKQCKANFENMAMTRKLCQNHEMESDFVAALNDATTIRVVGDKLYIYSENSDFTLTFARQK